jgi:hypothetical protein
MADCNRLVPTFRASTFACGTDAPLLSVTVPLMEPKFCCARNEIASNATQTTNTKTLGKLRFIETTPNHLIFWRSAAVRLAETPTPSTVKHQTAPNDTLELSVG